MTRHEKRRQDLLWTIHCWMVGHPDLMRKFGWRSCGRLTLGVLAALFLGLAPTQAADVTSEEKVSPLKALTSQAKKIEAQAEKAVQKVTKPAAKPLKPKSSFPDPDPEDEKAEGEVTDIKGLLVARNKRGMTVEYGVDSKSGVPMEVWLNFHSKVKLSGIKNLDELKDGDTVGASYKRTKETGRLLLTSVKLIQRKPKEVPPALPAGSIDEGDGALGAPALAR